jgi:glycosyltransferase involved in cell wall biosynthesis
MKVMHFHFGTDGGAERFFVHLVNALGRRKVAQKAVIRPRRAWRRDIEDAAEVVKESHFRTASLDRLLLPASVHRIARQWQPDAMLAWMPRARRLLPRRSECLRISRLGDYPKHLDGFENVDVLVCNTPGVVERVRQLGWDRPVEMISNFTNTEQVAPVDRKVLDTSDDVPLIGSMGRLVDIKGFDVLIRSLVHIKDAFAWIIGDGPELQSLRLLAQDLGVESRVRFAGWQSDPRPFIGACDAFALASNHETLGNVILEAWAQRVPVVSTRSKGPLWFMREQQNGLLVDIGDCEGLADALSRILSDRRLAHSLIAGGQQTLANQFSEEAVVQAYLRLFRQKSTAASLEVEHRSADAA